MKRLRLMAMIATIVVGTLFLVGAVLAQTPPPATPAPIGTAQVVVATPRPGPASPVDRQRWVYSSLADAALGHVIEWIQAETTALRSVPVGTSLPPAAYPAPLGTPGANIPIFQAQDLAALVVNMRAVLAVSERALDDLEPQVVAGGGPPPITSCPINQADAIRVADTALTEMQHALRRNQGAPAVEQRLISQLVQVRTRLQADMACLNPPVAVGTVTPARTATAVPLAATVTTASQTATPIATVAAGTSAPVTPVATSTVALNGATATPIPASTGTPIASGPVQQIQQAIQGLINRVNGLRATPPPAR